MPTLPPEATARVERWTAGGHSELSDEVRLDRAINGLLRDQPRMSAGAEPSLRRLRVVRGAGLLAALGLALWPMTTAVILSATLTVAYLAALFYKFAVLLHGVHGDGLLEVSDAEARAVPDAALPTFGILVPAYRETSSLPHLLQALRELDYPHDKLHVRVLLEADDTATIEVVSNCDLDWYVEAIIVPVAAPRTKPKACNYGLPGLRGEYVVIYDVEDIPEPLQLRRVAKCFAEADSDVSCMQARLAFYNAQQNQLTRWFALDYGSWFGLMMPGMVAWGAPIPLGGTSNFFKRSALDEVGGWDPFNVTEDADLGYRMARAGYRTAVVNSTTFEEANSDIVNWIKQRSRWYKGYLQTAAVHLRSPARTYREVGPRGVASLVLFVGGTPYLAALAPISWGLTLVWIVDRPLLVARLFPSVIYYLGLLCLVVGNGLTMYQGVVTAKVLKDDRLMVAALTAPLYWMLMSLAAMKALWQLVTQPFHWEKTEHGLHDPQLVGRSEQ